MSENIDCKAAAKYLSSHDNYHILIHHDPDGDAVGSGFALCFALRKMGKKANVMCSDDIPSKYSYITDSYTADKFSPDTIISTDVADSKLLGKKLAVFADYVELAIDHHATNTGFAKRLVIDPEASSACEVVYEIFKAGGFEVDELIATCIYTGMATDTGSFKYDSTTPRCHEIAAEIIRDYQARYPDLIVPVLRHKERGAHQAGEQGDQRSANLS